jgi:transposase
MELHRDAELGLSGRFALVQARERELSVGEVGRRFSVSLATVSRWSCRWRATPTRTARSTRPHQSPQHARPATFTAAGDVVSSSEAR